jgi:hypothetical protein
LRSMQEDVALFATQMLRLKSQVICQLYQQQTIVEYAAVEQMTPQDRALIPQALQLIKNRPLRNFRIEVAADSLVQIDEAQEKQDRLEFIQAFGGFMEKALPVATQAPQTMPILIELMKYGVGAFKQARQIEGVLDNALEQIKQAAQQPQQPKPDPEMAKVQADQAIQQQQIAHDQQADQMRLQSEQQIEMMRLQNAQAIEAMHARFDAANKQRDAMMEQRFEVWKAQLDAATSITTSEIAAKASMANAAAAAENKVTQDLTQ